MVKSLQQILLYWPPVFLDERVFLCACFCVRVRVRVRVHVPCPCPCACVCACVPFIIATLNKWMFLADANLKIVIKKRCPPRLWLCHQGFFVKADSSKRSMLGEAV